MLYKDINTSGGAYRGIISLGWSIRAKQLVYCSCDPPYLIMFGCGSLFL